MKFPTRLTYARQRGLSLIGMRFVGVVVAAAGLLVIKVIPTAIEYANARKAIDRAKVGTTVDEVRMLFDKAATIDDITSISGRDLEIAKRGEKVVVSFAYDREIHLVGPAYLVLKYQASTQ